MKHLFAKRELWQVTEWSKNGSVKKTRNTGRVLMVMVDLPLELHGNVARAAGGDLLVTPRRPEWPVTVDTDEVWWDVTGLP